MKKVIGIVLGGATILLGAAYKVPEQSLNAVALGGAYLSHTQNADAAYYNPANMAFLPEGRWLEWNALGIYLSPIKNGTTGHETEKEQFLLPQLHLVSQAMGRWRLGFSVTEPAGLVKRWSAIPEGYSANKFELRVLEVNPSFSFAVSNQMAIGAGLRYIYSSGEIRTLASALSPKMVLQGDTQAIGYNLAISYKWPDAGVAITYRSKVDLKEEGGVRFFGHPKIPDGFSIPARVSVPLPATLSVATDYTIGGVLTVEWEYERVFWSSYEQLHIVSPLVGAIVQRPKDWRDTNTFRIGLTYQYDQKIRWMAGYAYDQSPVPQKSLGYELPDSDANIFSFGVRYRLSEKIEIGMGYLFDYKKRRTVRAKNNTNIYPLASATFDGAEAHLLSFGIGYRY